MRNPQHQKTSLTTTSEKQDGNPRSASTGFQQNSATFGMTISSTVSLTVTRLGSPGLQNTHTSAFPFTSPRVVQPCAMYFWRQLCGPSVQMGYPIGSGA